MSRKNLLLVVGGLVLIGLLYLGWVWFALGDDAGSNSDVANQESATAKAVPEDYVQVIASENLSLAYPEDWQEATAEIKDGVVESGAVESPDYDDGGEGLGAPLAGYMLAWIVDDQPQYDGITDEYMEALASGQRGSGGEYKQITIDGNDAVWSTINSEGSYIWAETFVDGKGYYIRLETTDTSDAAAQQLFETILGTVDIF